MNFFVGLINSSKSSGLFAKLIKINPSITHLLNFFLKTTLNFVKIQKGSLITSDKSRFDFICNNF